VCLRGGLRRSGVALIGAILLGAVPLANGGMAMVASSAGSVAAQAASDPSAGVRVVGNRFYRDGAPWMPRGLLLIGALSPTHSGTAGVAADHLDENEMRAARSWGADAIRFNVSQPGLDPQDSLYSTAYVEEVRRAVTLARSFGFAVVVSVQDQGLGGGTRHAQPSPATVRDWQTLTSMFNSDLDVIYEMFTEPQNKADPASWDVWRNGGPAEDNQGVPAVGHQGVLEAIRATGSQNVVLAGGAQYARNFDGVPLLDDPIGQVGYAIHPYPDGITHDPASWDASWGNLTQIAPVMNTGWNAHSGNSRCKPDFPEIARQMMDYMAAHNIGQFGWAFDYPGTLVKDWTYEPTSFNGFKCGGMGYGVGEEMRARFLSADPVPPTTIPPTTIPPTTVPPTTVPPTAVAPTTSPAPTTTVTVGPATPPGIRFPAAADSRVEEAHAKTNYGKADLRTDASKKQHAESLVKFDVKGLTGPVVHATLRLYVTGATANAPSVYTTTSSWSETGKNGVTWRTRPGHAGAPVATAGALTRGTWVEYDVTSAVTGKDPVSFTLVSASTDGATFASRESSSRRPELAITSG
ncbi:MAG: DNRLRE domain-containing protein, partial [Actinobacteria bacterium]|nr:DNRLRE domain-containing protein [Actinomycetota bacterium]